MRIATRLGTKLVSADFNSREYYTNIRKAITAGYFMQARRPALPLGRPPRAPRALQALPLASCMHAACPPFASSWHERMHYAVSERSWRSMPVPPGLGKTHPVSYTCALLRPLAYVPLRGAVVSALSAMRDTPPHASGSACMQRRWRTWSARGITSR